MRITKSAKVIIKVIWICLLVIAMPFVIYYGIYGILGFLFSSWGGNEVDATYLLATIIPTAVLGYSTYLLFKWLRRLDRQDAHAKAIESSSLSLSIEEQQIVHTLDQHGGLTLTQMTSLTDIKAGEAMLVLKRLMDKNVVTQKIEAGLAVFYLVRNP